MFHQYVGLYIQHWRPVCDGIALQHVHILGHPLAELVAQVSHVQRLCSRCSSPGFKSDLAPPHPVSCLC